VANVLLDVFEMREGQEIMTNILLGFTGSVATTLAPKIIAAFEQLGSGFNVKSVATASAMRFLPVSPCAVPHVPVLGDKQEWEWPLYHSSPNTRDIWQKNDPILHIDLRNWADIFVIAPLSANTLAKIANGLCDNLLTSIIRAWDWSKPLIVAPSMNTYMWQSPFTHKHIKSLEIMFGGKNRHDGSFFVVPPQYKLLACGDEGEGAMANIDDIVEQIKSCLQWYFPLQTCPGIPINNHPGAFAFRRKYSHHCGVDLYTTPNQLVYAVEGGTVVGVEAFTGPQDNTPWWNNTDAILIEGQSGVVCYGEVGSANYGGPLKVGQKVRRGEMIARVKPVLPEDRKRDDIPGHSTSMLHLEFYKKGTHKASNSWKFDQPMPEFLIDPTPNLLTAIGSPGTM
jgi:phosphopantothenoylcysteine decarboxylase